MDNSNRALLYGEAVFTTMRMIAGSVKEWDSHFQRLKQGIDFVYGPIESWHWSPFRLSLEEKLKSFTGNQVLRVAIRLKELHPSASMALTVDNLVVEITTREIPKENRFPIKLRSIKQSARPDYWPSFLKSANSLEDDLLFLNEEGLIQESSIANIFIIREGKLLTPKLGANVLDGIMRRKVLKIASNFFKEVHEVDILFNESFTADAIFLTNSVRGPFLVDRIDQFAISYPNDFLKKFADIKELVMR